LRFWAHGDEPGARAFAEKNGFARVRVLWQMRRSLTEPLPDIPLPAGITLRGFRPGHDEQDWLGVNARAFAHHPEQGRWTLDDLRLREDEPWFDPAGFLLAVDIEDTVLGFHWTKVHTDPAIGEIYVLGVVPDGHRRGLGAALSVAGLRHLAGQGLTEAMLYVDESNTAAVALYRRLGFEIYKTDVSYQRA
jgi:mycothiol synthase